VGRAEIRPTGNDLLASLKVWPQGRQIPDTFLAQDWGKYAQAWRLPVCLKDKTLTCDVYPIDFDGENKAALLVMGQGPASGQPTLFTQETDTVGVSLPPLRSTIPSVRSSVKSFRPAITSWSRHSGKTLKLRADGSASSLATIPMKTVKR